MKTKPQIVSAKVLESYVVVFHLNDGRHVTRNFMFLRGGIFEPIWRDPRKFRRLKVVGGVPTWPGNVDLDPDVVLRGLHKRKILRDAVVGQDGRLLPATPTTSL
jgi:hypothetical protein